MATAPARPRVLVVDDDPASVAATCAVLEDRFDVLSATSGHGALEALARAPVDVVVADYQMPGMDGVALLDRVARLPGHAGRVLLTGARDARVGWEAARDRELFYLLEKGCAPARLLETVARAAERAGMRRRLTEAAEATRAAARRVLAELGPRDGGRGGDGGGG